MDKKEFNETMSAIQTVLIHCIGDIRVCPHCKKEFVPLDRAGSDALDLYKMLETFKK